MSIFKLKEIVEDMVKKGVTYLDPYTRKIGEYYMDFCDLNEKIISQDQPYIVQFGMIYTKDESERDVDFVFFTTTINCFELSLSEQLNVFEGQNIRIAIDENGKDFYEFTTKYKECIKFEINKSTSSLNIHYKILPLF